MQHTACFARHRAVGMILTVGASTQYARLAVMICIPNWWRRRRPSIRTTPMRRRRRTGSNWRRSGVGRPAGPSSHSDSTRSMDLACRATPCTPEWRRFHRQFAARTASARIRRRLPATQLHPCFRCGSGGACGAARPAPRRADAAEHRDAVGNDRRRDGSGAEPQFGRACASRDRRVPHGRRTPHHCRLFGCGASARLAQIHLARGLADLSVSQGRGRAFPARGPPG